MSSKQNQVVDYGLKSCDLSSPLRRTAGNSTHFCPAHLLKIAPKHSILHAKAITSNDRFILNSFHRGRSSWKVNLETKIIGLQVNSQHPTRQPYLWHLKTPLPGCPESQARGPGRRSHRCPSNLQKASLPTKTSQLRIGHKLVDNKSVTEWKPRSFGVPFPKIQARFLFGGAKLGYRGQQCKIHLLEASQVLQNIQLSGQTPEMLIFIFRTGNAELKLSMGPVWSTVLRAFFFLLGSALFPNWLNLSQI